ncbi:hypothetical protein LTR84_011449 [Exophiala bonariae]|uniref:FAD-binding domain-containing protein n=1 Tax=Exophiala bonariae TaxID=1690606 RepID=A0AAV9MS18_9EURO|nr:hypothetical protein LTR84_011449 [Exophiala bonariae]
MATACLFDPLHILIVGAGTGGLACALACRQAKPPIRVTLLERASELLPIGAGIQIPPNAARIMDSFGLSEKLVQAGGIIMDAHVLRRYANGSVLVDKSWVPQMRDQYGADWLAEYQLMLVDEVKRAGVDMRMGAEVIKVNIDSNEPSVVLKDGSILFADVVVGADGLWSTTRNYVLELPVTPRETGDLAYRGTFSAQQLASLKDERISELLSSSSVQVWMGPQKHVVFYPVRSHTEFNLVLLCPDTVPKGKRTAEGNLKEMEELFEGWDPILRKLISGLKTALKWKLHHVPRQETWTKGASVLIGDASHPTLPYQAQGAAMAIEDGAVLGLLLSHLDAHRQANRGDKHAQVASILRLFERLRKQRTEINVAGAVEKQDFYHLPDGDLQVERDQVLSDIAQTDFKAQCKWSWGDKSYNDELLGFDVLHDAEEGFKAWIEHECPMA